MHREQTEKDKININFHKKTIILLSLLVLKLTVMRALWYNYCIIKVVFTDGTS